jgi:hypothetical protein
MICGSIGYGGIDEIGRLYSFLFKAGFGIVDHLVSKGADYSDIKDFRDKKELSHQIVNHDLEYVKKAAAYTSDAFDHVFDRLFDLFDQT